MSLIRGCRDAIFLHESFGESFGAFDAGRCLGRAKEGHASLFKFIRKALGQDGLRTGDGKVDLSFKVSIRRTSKRTEE